MAATDRGALPTAERPPPDVVEAVLREFVEFLMPGAASHRRWLNEAVADFVRTRGGT